MAALASASKGRIADRDLARNLFRLVSKFFSQSPSSAQIQKQIQTSLISFSRFEPMFSALAFGWLSLDSSLFRSQIMKLASMYFLSFVLGFHIWNCSGAKSVQPSKPFPLGEYEYAGFDKKGDKIVEGKLAITSREGDRIKGEWQLNRIGNPERIGPQTGTGECDGLINEDSLFINLNPNMVDNNVHLKGKIKDGRYSGTWSYDGVGSGINRGTFEAVKTIRDANRLEDENNPELSLLHKYGWTVEGNPTDGTVDLPNPITRLLSTRQYLQASKGIGLDFSSYAGQTLPLRNYRVSNEAERGHDLRAHLLLADKKIVGAWLTVFAEEIAPGIYALNVLPHKRN